MNATMVLALVLAGILIGLLVWYAVVYFGWVSDHLAAVPEWYVLVAVLVALSLIAVSIRYWPKTIQPLPLHDYAIPMSTFYLSWFTLSVLGAHTFLSIRRLESQGQGVGGLLPASQHLSGLGAAAGMFYLLWRTFPGDYVGPS